MKSFFLWNHFFFMYFLSLFKRAFVFNKMISIQFLFIILHYYKFEKNHYIFYNFAVYYICKTKNAHCFFFFFFVRVISNFWIDSVWLKIHLFSLSFVISLVFVRGVVLNFSPLNSNYWWQIILFDWLFRSSIIFISVFILGDLKEILKYLNFIGVAFEIWATRNLWKFNVAHFRIKRKIYLSIFDVRCIYNLAFWHYKFFEYTGCSCPSKQCVAHSRI